MCSFALAFSLYVYIKIYVCKIFPFRGGGGEGGGGGKLK